MAKSGYEIALNFVLSLQISWHDVTPCNNKVSEEVQVFSHDPKIDGTLNNISKSGLAFQYTPIAGKKMDTNSINIFVKGTDRFYLSDIACRIIYDISTLDESQRFKGTERRQCGIKFVELKENQQNKLELLLKNYTIQSFDNSY